MSVVVTLPLTRIYLKSAFTPHSTPLPVPKSCGKLSACPKISGIAQGVCQP